MSGYHLEFSVDDLAKKYASVAAPYNEFMRRRGMSLGWFRLPVGGEDKQHPHMADEVYIVLKGKGTLRVVDDDIEVSAGNVVSVDHGEEHRFVDVKEDLEMIVIFAPPDLPDED